jgi:hypothetical protein
LEVEMAYRFTSTEKWRDSWFSKLKPMEKLLFLYLCDSCDIAGFIEINTKIWAAELNCREYDVKGALKGLARGLVFSQDMECIFIKNFIKHQKNLPINENNTVHRGILKRLNEYAERFNTQDINDFIDNKIEGALKGLDSPIGLGKGKGNGIGKENTIPEYAEFKEYALENKKNVDLPSLKLKYEAWKANGWRDGKGKEILNWKSKILNTLPYIKEKNSGNTMF